MTIPLSGNFTTNFSTGEGTGSPTLPPAYRQNGAPAAHTHTVAAGRVPGAWPKTHRPRFTERKHQAILDRIKAQRVKNGLPATVRPLDAIVESEQEEVSSDGFRLGETLHDFGQRIWSQAGKMVHYIGELVPTPMGVAGEEEGVCSTDGNCDVPQQASTPKERFVAECAKNGFSEDEVKKIQSAWRRRGIPLNEKTAPLRFFGELEDKGPSAMPGGKNHLGSFVVAGNLKKCWVKCYGDPKSIESVGDMPHYYKATGIDSRKPKFEARNILAWKIAEHLKWDVVPFAGMAYVDGEPCLASEYIEGQRFHDFVTASDELLKYSSTYMYEEAGKIGTETDYTNGSDIPVLKGKAKEDWYRLALLGLLSGDKDRNFFQFLLYDDAAGMKGIDWDMAFGKDIHSIEALQTKLAPHIVYDGHHSRWPPDKELPKLRDEFTITRDELLGLADGLLNEAEKKALGDRYDDVMKKLQSV